MKGDYVIKNKYEIRGNTVAIFIKNRKGEVYECYIDLDDLDRLKESEFTWHLLWDKKNEWYYIATSYRYGEKGNRKGGTIYLHRFIMNVTDKTYRVDHINHNTMDNRKSNLKVTTQQINLLNRKGANKNNNTGVRNVSYIEQNNEYWVQIMKKGERYKWVFQANQFEEACQFAEIKRNELFGKLIDYVN